MSKSMTGALALGEAGVDLQEFLKNLARRDGVFVELFDPDGNVVLGAGRGHFPCQCGEADRLLCIRARERQIAKLLETGRRQRGRCPVGHILSAVPLTLSSALFGGMLVCSARGRPSKPAAGDRRIRSSEADRIRSSEADVTPSQERRDGAYVNGLVRAISSLVARSCFKEMEAESLTRDLALRYEELSLLYEIGERIPLHSDQAAVVRYVIEASADVIDCVCLSWYSWRTNECEVITTDPSHDRPDDELRQDVEKLSEILSRRARALKEPQALNRMDGDLQLAPFTSRVNAALAFPLGMEGEEYGCLSVFRSRGQEFQSQDSKLLQSLARKAAVVIKNSNLYRELNELFLNTMRTLIFVIEGKDAYTRGHSERVNQFSLLLADLRGGMPSRDRETLNWSSLLHDIGKQRIPDCILQKPGKLDPEERAQIQKHPGYGVELLRPIRQLAECLPNIRHHHERIDGLGYPDGLAGDEIPLGARFIAVADTFDALTSDRCYRPRFTREGALGIIAEVAGTQLDPELAQLLINNSERFLIMCQEANETVTTAVADAGSSEPTGPGESH